MQPTSPQPTNGTLLPARTNGAAPAKPERKATILLDGERVAVRTLDGFLTRVQRKVRLTHGPDLYHPGKGRPGLDDKVTPYQPGYMKLVAAMGGQLLCPPAIRDPVSGSMRPNPLVETYPDTGLIRRVTATGVCVARNPATGEIHASVQTIVLDAEHILREALLKISREDCVSILSKDDIDADRAEDPKKLRGKLILPLAPPHAYIVADMKEATVRAAIQTFQSQSGTIRQRACSKAERLAADHNPVTRMSWLGGRLTWPEDGGPPYAEVNVVAWVDHRGQEEMEKFLAALASHQQLEGVSTVVGEHGDDDADMDVDTEPEGAWTSGDRALPDRGEPSDPLAGVRAPEREPVPVERTAEPRREAAPAAAPDLSPAELAALRTRADWLEQHLPDGEVAGVRQSLAERRPTDRMDAAGLRRLVAELEPIAEDLGVTVRR